MVAIVVIVAVVAMIAMADYETNPNLLHTVNGLECFRRDVFILEITVSLNKQ
jgi:hypothetical protein